MQRFRGEVYGLGKIRKGLGEFFSSKVLELQLQAGLGIGNKHSFFVAEDLEGLIKI